MIAPTGSLGRLLKRDSAIVIASLAAVTLFAWLYLIVLARAMAEGDIRLMGMATMKAMGEMGGALIMEPQAWTGATFILMLVMWWVMMIGMMIPSAAPMILIYDRVQRKRLAKANAAWRTGLFTLGYVLTWLGFSLVATLLQWALSKFALLSPMMVGTSHVLAAAIFAIAGLYQFTSLKHACLANCRMPIHFLAAHWRNGNLGALRMGLHHGAFCVGCCWFLMALLFVGGVMNLLWVAAIAAFVLLEKILPRGLWVSRASGAAMLGFSLVLAVHAWPDHL